MMDVVWSSRMMPRKNACVFRVEANPFFIMFSAVYFYDSFYFTLPRYLGRYHFGSTERILVRLFAFGQKNQNFVLIHFTILFLV